MNKLPMSTKKKVMIIGGAAVLGLGLLVLLIVASLRQAANDPTNEPASITRDKDSGELLTDDPALGRESTGGDLLVLGLPDLIDRAGLLGAQSDYIKEQLAAYNTQKLKSAYKTVTIQPQNTSATLRNATTTVRLGDTDKTVQMRIVTDENALTFQVFITDPNKQGGGDYTSPPLDLQAE